jgi:hypothetical protein
MPIRAFDEHWLKMIVYQISANDGTDGCSRAKKIVGAGESGFVE